MNSWSFFFIGYVFSQPLFNDLTGNRTRVYAVRGRRLDRLTIRPYSVLSWLFATDSYIIAQRYGFVKHFFEKI